MSDPVNPGQPAALPDSIPDLPPHPEAPAGHTRRTPGRPQSMDESRRLGRVIQVRIDKVLQTALADYMVKNNMTLSQAMRVLLTLGLDSERVNPDAVFHMAAFREGLFQGLATVREKIGSAVAQALQDMTTEIGDGEE